MVSVISAGLAIGSTTDQKVRKMPGAVDLARPPRR